MPFNPALHLFAILNDPCPDRLCLLVMVTTVYPERKHDPACTLDVGDHPFIKHPSYMLYRMAETLGEQLIQRRLGQQYYRANQDFSDPVLERIIGGLYASDETRGRILTYAEGNGL